MHRPYRPRNSNKREPVVEDLREKLNRIKQEKALNVEGSKNRPPPDPAYNFLKDPLRGDNCANSVTDKKVANKDPKVKYEVKCESKANDAEHKSSHKPVETSPRMNRNGNFDRRTRAPGGWQKQNWKNYTPQNEQQPRQWKDKTETQNSTKQQSVNNIKIIVSSESGERKCTIDETALVQIPVGPRKNYAYKPKSGKLSQKSSPTDYSDANKQKPLEGNKDKPAEDADKQLQTDSNENKCQTVTPKETLQEANDDADNLVSNNEKSDDIMSDNTSEQIKEEQRAIKTIEEKNIEATNNETGLQAEQVQE